MDSQPLQDTISLLLSDKEQPRKRKMKWRFVDSNQDQQIYHFNKKIKLARKKRINELLSKENDCNYSFCFFYIQIQIYFQFNYLK